MNSFVFKVRRDLSLKDNYKRIERAFKKSQDNNDDSYLDGFLHSWCLMTNPTVMKAMEKKLERESKKAQKDIDFIQDFEQSWAVLTN